MNQQLIACLCLLGALALGADATEYFVRVDGSDANDGLARETAFATVQRGVDALQPGNTLTIGPGEYFGSVRRENLGSEEAETVIRAEIPGTVLLRGDVPVDGFERVEGYRFVFVADFDRQPYAVAEADTLNLMYETLYLDELEFMPGTYHYDAEAGRLYISTTDMAPPSQHRYRVSVTPTSGLRLTHPTRVVVEGIGATGFNLNEALHGRDGFGTRWGIHFDHATRSAIRNCTAFLNAGGILIMGPDGGGGNVIEGCTAFGNGSRHGNEGGNIAIIRGGDGDTLRDNYVYRSSAHGMRFYICHEPGELLIADSIGWGNKGGDQWIKGIAGPYRAERLISLGFDRFNVREGTGAKVDSISGIRSNRQVDVHNTIFLGDEANLDLEAEFADPTRMDFRLQSTSRFRGAGPEGQDIGPHPFTGDVRFVKPDGDDDADGLSVATAWRTLAHALPELSRGDTLYLLEGAYPEDVSASLDGVSIRGRGGDTVVAAGDWDIRNAEDASLKRMTFTASLSIAQGREVAIENCVFMGGEGLRVRAAEGLRIVHGAFERTLNLGASTRVFLSGNAFGASPAAALDSRDGLLYSDYNSFPAESGAWLVAGDLRDLGDARDTRERYSVVVRPPFEFTGETPEFRDRIELGAAGPMGTAIGPYFEGQPRQLRIEGPFVHSVSNTTANIEWWASQPSVVEFSWGETPDMENTRRMHQHNFGGYSLTGLEPGRTYHYRLTYLRPFAAGRQPIDLWTEYESVRAISGTFNTAPTPRAPRTYYVALVGSEGNDGLARESAWRTLNHAASKVGPGDTVMVAGGRYTETVWLRATGDEGKPITFRNIPGERVVFDGVSRKLFGAFTGVGKHHLVFDGFYAENLGHIVARGSADLALERGGMFALSFSSHIEIHRCLMDGRGIMYSPSILTADTCSDLLMKNCVVMAGMDRARVTNTPRVSMQNNVFFRNLISHVMIENHWNQPVELANNIFTDSLPGKFNAPMIVAGRLSSLTLRNNCFYPREQSGRQKAILWAYSDEEFEGVRANFVMDTEPPGGPSYETRLRAAVGEEHLLLENTGTIEADPMFRCLADAPERDHRDRPVYPPDSLRDAPVDFDSFFTTNPELIERGIGLQPEAFEEFGFER